MKAKASEQPQADITERKRAAEALRAERVLRASAEQWQETFDGVVEAICVLDADAKILQCNRAMAQLVGRDLEKCVGRNCCKLVHGSPQPLEGCPFQRMRKSLRREAMELRVEDRWLQVTVGPLKDDEGKPTGAVHVITDITERKQAEEKLRASEELYRALFEQAADSIVLLDVKGKMLEFNDKAHEALGYTREEFQRLKIADFDVIESPEEVKAHIEKIAREGSATFETKHRTKSGEIRDIVVTTRAVDVPGPGCLLAIFHDITERKKAEQEVRSLARFLSENPYPVLRVGADGTILYANSSASPLLRAKRSAVGKPAPRPWRQMIADVLESGSVQRMEVEHAGRIFAFRAVPVAEAGYVNLYGVETTQRVRARKELRQERDFAASLVDTAQSVIVVLDTRGRIVRFNRFAEELTGYTEQQVRGKEWFKTFLPAAERERIGEVFQDILDGRPARGVENPILVRDGGEILICWYNSTLYDAEGKVLGVLAIGYDITEMRAREAQLRHAQKMEAVGRFAGGVAHDFRNQLTVIKGYAEMLTRQSRSGDSRIEKILEILKAVDQSAMLTDHLLAFSRKQDLHPEVVGLNSMLDGMAGSLGRIIGEDIRLAVVPGAAADGVRVDPGQLQQAVMNLVVNARDAMPKGGRLTVQTASVELDEKFLRDHPGAAPGEYVTLAVSDTGAGMDKGTLQKVFEPFFTTKPPGEGTGLGLSMVYGFVNQSGGHVSIRSEPSRGTTVTIHLPRAAGPAKSVEPADPATQLPRGTGTILVAEDAEAIRQLIVRTLREFGYTAMEAGNAPEALPLGRHYAGDIDLLLTDVVMPGMDGVELAESVRAARPGVKVLYMTGYSDKAPTDHGVSAGDAKVLIKPFSAKALLDAVHQVLRGEQV